MKFNEVDESGFYVTEDDEDKLCIYEVFKNSDAVWIVDEWIYKYIDYDDRKVYSTTRNVEPINCLDSSNIIKLENKFKMFGEAGQYLIEDKPTYKELYMQLLEINKMLEQENQELKDKLSKIKK